MNLSNHTLWLKSWHDNLPGGTVTKHGYIESDYKRIIAPFSYITQRNGEKLVHSGIHTFLNKKDAKTYIIEGNFISFPVIVKVRVNPKNVLGVGPICYNGSTAIFMGCVSISSTKVFISEKEFNRAIKQGEQ